MSGLFGTLSLGARSLATQQKGVEIAGHNLANVNNTAYARQRLIIQTSLTIPSSVGIQGTGAEAVAIQQVRNSILDRQIQSEKSITGYWQAQQIALQYGDANLGQEIDTQTDGTSSASSAANLSGGLAGDLTDLFNSFQSVSLDPSSASERKALLAKAEALATRLNEMDARFANLRDWLNASIQDDVSSANELLQNIADFNANISRAEASGYEANDLRDLRLQKIEELSKLASVTVAEQSNGTVNVALDGTLLVSGVEVAETLEAYDAGGGRYLVRAETAGTALTLTGGSIQGTIEARDGALAALRGDLNTLAATLITQVNTIHSTGFSLTGTTGAAFFTGTGAGDIALNATLSGNPALFQAAGVANAAGDNQVVLALAQLANTSIAALGGRTFSQAYARTVSDFGNALASVNDEVSDQETVEQMLQKQRSSVSGVSLDEEMVDLVKFQKAFSTSARLISMVDEMLTEIVNMKR